MSKARPWNPKPGDSVQLSEEGRLLLGDHAGLVEGQTTLATIVRIDSDHDWLYLRWPITNPFDPPEPRPYARRLWRKSTFRKEFLAQWRAEHPKPAAE